MSKNEFDELLLKKLREADFEYNPASWEKLAAQLPASTPSGTESFDGLLIKKLQEEELAYKPERWEQLATMLPPVLSPVAEVQPFVPKNNGRKWALAAGIAAAFALIMGTAVFLKQANQNTELNNNTSVATTQQPVKKNIAPATQNTNSAAQQANPSLVNQQANPVAQSNSNKALPQNNQQPVQSTQRGLFNNNVNPFTQQKATQQQPEQIAQNQILPQPVPVVEMPEETQNIPTIIKPENEKRPSEIYAYSGNNEVSAFYEGKGVQKNAKTSIALGGGVNYGNLNTGYTAGVTVRRKITRDIFVDGTVAMMYNNNASNVAVNNGPSLADPNTAARPASFNETPLSSPALDPIQKLYYVQFNPSIGYQLEKHVAVSVGGDFQQMLNKKEEIVQPESNNSRLFPNFDVGLTTKSEFSITPNIQAGIMYREGLNNLFKNDGSKYVNRRYVQVQFKYNIPVN
jgi:hypothetical protein